MYLWSTNLYEKYAPYIQEQLPDIHVEFVVGNNDLDFYRFLKENGGLPDIITCCRFSLHDASPLKDSLMDLSTTNAAGAVYDTYLNDFMNEDGSVNWLPWTDAIGVPPTVPRITQKEKVWTVSSGRGLLNVWSSSSGIQDYQSFNTQLLDEKSTSENVVLNSKKSYSNRFHCDGAMMHIR